MSYRSSPSFAIGGVDPAFVCLCCGSGTGTMMPLEVRALCCKCADEHGEYEFGYCTSCGAEQEYSPCEDDIGFSSYPREPGDGFGMPLSSMNGNAAVANVNRENRTAWDNWVAFCERNGLP